MTESLAILEQIQNPEIKRRAYEVRYTSEQLRNRIISAQLPLALPLEASIIHITDKAYEHMPFSQASIELVLRQGYQPFAKADIVGLGLVERPESDPDIIGDLYWTKGAQIAQAYTSELARNTNKGEKVVCVSMGGDEFYYFTNSKVDLSIFTQQPLSTETTYISNENQILKGAVRFDKLEDDEKKRIKEDFMTDPTQQKSIVQKFLSSGNVSYELAEIDISLDSASELSILYNSLFDARIHKKLLVSYPGGNRIRILDNLHRVLRSRNDFFDRDLSNQTQRVHDSKAILKFLNSKDVAIGDEFLFQRVLNHFGLLLQNESDDWSLLGNGSACMSLRDKDNGIQINYPREVEYGQKFSFIEVTAEVLQPGTKNQQEITAEVDASTEKDILQRIEDIPYINFNGLDVDDILKMDPEKIDESDNTLISTHKPILNTIAIMIDPAYIKSTKISHTYSKNKRRYGRADALGIELTNDIGALTHILAFHLRFDREIDPRMYLSLISLLQRKKR